MPTLPHEVDTTALSAEFSYDVHFTEGLFRPDNPLLVDTIGDASKPLPKKMIAVVDEGLLPHHDDLLDRIGAYAEAHPDILPLSAAPVVVPGGEAAKNDPALVDHIHEVIYETRLDRHSYVPELEAHIDEPEHPRCLFQGLDSFREHLGGELTIMLLDAIGDGVEGHSVDRARYREAIALLRERAATTSEVPSPK